MNIAIIIVTRNHLRDMQECLPSLAAQTRLDFTILVSDNGSEDGTADWVRREYPAVQVVENRANLGFAEGSNVGLRWALAAGARHVVLLNPDTVVDPRWLEELVRSAEADETIGVCQSKIYRYPASTPPVINTVGNRLHYTGVGWCGHLDEVDRGQFAEDVEIPYASGAAMLVKAEVVRDIGLLDADLFMYHDDLDWSVRARLRGHRIVLSAQSVVYHRYDFRRNGTSGAGKFFFLERNRLIWLCKTHRASFLLLILPALLAMEGAVLYYALVGGWLGAKLRSYADFLRLNRRWRATRRTIQSTRTVSDKSLVAAFNSRLSVPDAGDSTLFRLANVLFHWYWKLCLRFVQE
ncbi:MAG TPA: glycosyltransferase family 2 protein [Planctomycetaceae bacterium]|nr:glycosyltransferase family 2 protein [Planctomycetaceae bacterium]